MTFKATNSQKYDKEYKNFHLHKSSLEGGWATSEVTFASKAHWTNWISNQLRERALYSRPLKTLLFKVSISLGLLVLSLHLDNSKDFGFHLTFVKDWDDLLRAFFFFLDEPFLLPCLIGGVSEPESKSFNEELLALLPMRDLGFAGGSAISSNLGGLMAFLTLAYLSHFFVPILLVVDLPAIEWYCTCLPK